MRGRWTSLLLVAVGLVGCVSRPLPPPPVAQIDGPARVAVLPFRAGALRDDGRLQPVPVDGSSEEIEAGIARQLTQRLAALRVPVSDADAVAGATSLADAGAYDVRLASHVAGRVGAPLAILGALTRFRQREGTAWAARTPASVEYEVVLVRASDGAIVQLDHFEYTQQALSENVLDLPRFLSGGGRWLTREDILDGALGRTAARLARTLGIPPAGRPAGGAAR